MAKSPIIVSRSELLGLSEAPVRGTTDGISIVETGAGPIRQVVVKLSSVAFTMTDNGTNGSGSLKLFDLPKGIFTFLPAAGKVTLTYGTVTDANVIGSVGTAAAGADGTLSSTEADLCPSTACATTAGTGTFTIKGTTTGVTKDGSSSAAVYLNLATSTDPSTNNSLTLNGMLTITYVNAGDPAGAQS